MLYTILSKNVDNNNKIMVSLCFEKIMTDFFSDLMLNSRFFVCFDKSIKKASAQIYKNKLKLR